MGLNKRFNRVIQKCKKNNNYSLLLDFIKKESSGYLMKRKKDELLRMVPSFLEYTNSDNCKWMSESKMMEIDGFEDTMKMALKDINVYIHSLSYKDIISLFNKNTFYDKELIDILLKKYLNYDDSTKIFVDLCSVDVELASYFLQNLKILDSSFLDSIVTLINISSSIEDSVKKAILAKNIDFFLKRTNDHLQLYYSTKNDDATNMVVAKYINDNVEKIFDVKNMHLWESYYNICNEEKKKYIIDFLNSNFDDFIKCYSNIIKEKKELQEVTNLEKDEDLKKKVNDLYIKIDNYIENNFKEVLSEICLFKFGTNSESYIQDKNLVLDVFYMIFDEVCENEGVMFSDIFWMGGGNYSDAYCVGDKIIKIGHNRETFNFPNNPYIITPLLRKKIDIEGFTFKSIYIEIQERVEILREKIVGEEDLYQLYKNLRNLGLVWLDVRPSNVGRLLKDNIVHWNNNLFVENDSLGFDGSRGDIVLQKGDLVILDGDFIFEEGKVSEEYYEDDWGFTEIREKFEERYQDEKSKPFTREYINKNVSMRR